MRRVSVAGRRAFIFVEDYLRLEYILYAFWAIFWTLNGLDKFFNGTLVEGPSGPRLVGWFGVNRDAKFMDYFSRLSLPPELALTCLYGFAVLEVVVGVTFIAILLSRKLPPTVNRLALKVSMLIFLAFATGDILFGDRQELWEHGTFMILTLMTYQLYLARATEYADVVGSGRFEVTDQDGNRRIDAAEYAAFLERRRQSVMALAKELDQERKP